MDVVFLDATYRKTKHINRFQLRRIRTVIFSCDIVYLSLDCLLLSIQHHICLLACLRVVLWVLLPHCFHKCNRYSEKKKKMYRFFFLIFFWVEILSRNIVVYFIYQDACNSFITIVCLKFWADRLLYVSGCDFFCHNGLLEILSRLLYYLPYPSGADDGCSQSVGEMAMSCCCHHGWWRWWWFDMWCMFMNRLDSCGVSPFLLDWISLAHHLLF